MIGLVCLYAGLAGLAVLTVFAARAEATRARVSRVVVPRRDTCTRVRLVPVDHVDELTARRAG